MVPGLEQRAAHTRAAVRRQGFFLRRLGVAGIQKSKIPERKAQAERSVVDVLRLRTGQPGQQHGQRAAAERIRLARLGCDRLDSGPFGLAEHLPELAVFRVGIRKVRQDQRIHQKVLQHGVHAADVVGMGVGHNDIVELPHPGRTQRGGERIGRIRRTGVDQAMLAFAADQDAVALADVEKCDGRIALRKHFGAGAVHRHTEPFVQLGPGRQAAEAAARLDEIGGHGQQHRAHNADDKTGRCGAARRALTLRHIRR